MRITITFQCMECKRKNYTTTKNKQTVTERLTLSKYCKWCRRHTGHKEIK